MQSHIFKWIKRLSVWQWARYIISITWAEFNCVLLRKAGSCVVTLCLCHFLFEAFHIAMSTQSDCDGLDRRWKMSQSVEVTLKFDLFFLVNNTDKTKITCIVCIKHTPVCVSYYTCLDILDYLEYCLTIESIQFSTIIFMFHSLCPFYSHKCHRKQDS